MSSCQTEKLNVFFPNRVFVWKTIELSLKFLHWIEMFRMWMCSWDLCQNQLHSFTALTIPIGISVCTKCSCIAPSVFISVWLACSTVLSGQSRKTAIENCQRQIRTFIRENRISWVCIRANWYTDNCSSSIGVFFSLLASARINFPVQSGCGVSKYGI